MDANYLPTSPLGGMSRSDGVCYDMRMDRFTTRERDRFGSSGSDGAGMRPRILVVGSASPWLEGVVDLLQLAGYEASLLSDWLQAEREIRAASAELAILDLSDHVDSLDLPERLTALTPAGGLPLLLLNSTGDDRIWHLERMGDPSRGRVELYAHSLLGPTALLEKVEGCLAPRPPVVVG